ncbi:MAG: hypothetical protein PHO20_02805 [Candidatus Peribacteraceae bacterium]|nr:hypothetical protein [Candidatus Peribacteraceae bacterium]MDD5739671.1 hypothetical protein [Candidatus Peribacteraceae bacterium]
MELQTFTIIIGLFILLLALPLLISGEKTFAFVQELLRNEWHLRCVGAVIVVITVLTLKQNYSIGTDAAGLIRIVAWLGLIKGLTAAWFPAKLVSLTNKVFDDAGTRPVLAVVAIAIGALLLYGSELV